MTTVTAVHTLVAASCDLRASMVAEQGWMHCCCRHAEGDTVCCRYAPHCACMQDSDWLLRRKTLPIINTVGASVMLLAMGSYWLYFVKRVIK